MGTEDAERQLIAKCQAGDRQAFNRLVMRYQNLVYNFLYRLASRWDDINVYRDEQRIPGELRRIQLTAEQRSQIQSIMQNTRTTSSDAYL
jgi:hypothetical protein